MKEEEQKVPLKSTFYSIEKKDMKAFLNREVDRRKGVRKEEVKLSFWQKLMKFFGE